MRTQMRKCLFLLAALLALASVLVLPARADSGLYVVKVKGTFEQTSARSMLAMVNQFRTGKDAWAWNPDNQTKYTYSNLGTLTYDYGLEKVAMQRAMEIALSFAHERPNGSSCFSAYSLANNSYTQAGENIAAGYPDARRVFAGWQETDEPYMGQGHRRNMLDPGFNAIGIGHVVYNGVHYWVQELGYSRTPVTAATSPNNSSTLVAIEVSASQVQTVKMTNSVNSLNVEYGSSISLPESSASITLANTWPGKACAVNVAFDWTVQDGNIASISGGRLTGKSTGSTSAMASALGKTFSVPVNVKPRSIANAAVSLEAGTWVYDGTARTPAVKSVLCDEKALAEGKDYSVSYANHVNAGSATVKITGKGNYTGTVEKQFSIAPAQLASVATVDAIAKQAYTGSAIQPNVIVRAGAGQLRSGTDYSVSAADNVNAGKATAVITGKGNYAGQMKQTFVIEPAPMKLCNVESIPAQLYTGGDILPAVKVTYRGKALKLNADYTVSGRNNREPGMAALTITGRGNFSGALEAKFEIVKYPSVALPAKGTVSVALDSKLQVDASGLGTAKSWKSSNTRVAQVSGTGLVTPVKEGSAKITVKTANGKKATVKVKVVDPYKPTGVKLDRSGTVTLNMGETLKLTPELTPKTARTQYAWTSSSKKVATVKDGVVTPLKEGSAKITVKTANGKKATVKVKVVDPYKPTGVKLDRSGTVTLNMGETLKLTPELTPKTARTQYTWTSSSKKVAMVKDGVVTPVKEGSAKITVKTANGKKATVKVKVVDPYKPTGVKLDRSGTVTLRKGETLKLNATLTPETARTSLKWSSSKRKVASVTEDGTVKAIAKGTATITVKTTNGKTAKVKIKVVN